MIKDITKGHTKALRKYYLFILLENFLKSIYIIIKKIKLKVFKDIPVTVSVSHNIVVCLIKIKNGHYTVSFKRYTSQ